MRGFPKHINCAQDFKNLLKMPEFKAQCITELKRVKNLKDDKITKATTQIDPTDPESEWNTIEVANPNPKWKRMKFKNKKEITDLISSVEVVPNGKQKTH